MEDVGARNLRVPFDVVFCTANRDNWRKYKLLKARAAHFADNSPEKADLLRQMDALDLGGDIVALNKVTISGPPPGKSSAKVISDEPVKRAYSPNHFRNKTRNFRISSNGMIRKAHIRLILKFNGQEVAY